MRDGFCNDENNNEGCAFDGGDCCGSDIDVSPYHVNFFCSRCFCFEDLECTESLLLIGDGFCNDETNNAECLFDGGDCCLSCTKTDNCSDCVCHGEVSTDFSC